MTGILQFIPWVVCAATAVWFGWMAQRANRNWFSWGLAGAMFGLITTTIVLGLGHAMANPFSDRDRTLLHVKLTIAAVIVVAALGWIITMSLHRHHLAIWQRVNKSPATPLPAPAPPAAGSARNKPATPTRQPPAKG